MANENKNDGKINILLVDDQPAKLLSYEVILADLGENLLKASSADEAFDQLLRADIAVVLMDVSMPDMDGFQLAAMIREHPRFQNTAIIFVSAIRFTDEDLLRGYQMGAVDYVPVPVVPQVLLAKVKVFAELHRKTRQLEALNRELEHRVADRTRELESSTARLRASEERRSLALVAGQMGSWDWDLASWQAHWDEGQYRICDVDPASFRIDALSLEALIDPEDWPRLQQEFLQLLKEPRSMQTEFRLRRADGQRRWCFAAAASTQRDGHVAQISGVTIDITDRKEAEERQLLLTREVDHRAKNALALAQSIVKLSKGETVEAYISAVEGRIMALSRAHALLARTRWQGADIERLIEEEMAPHRNGDVKRFDLSGPALSLEPRAAQSLALALHELATNAAKYGALSQPAGRLQVSWDKGPDGFMLRWTETGGPVPTAKSSGFGLRVIRASIEQQLGGRVRFDWKETGLDCLLHVPLDLVARSAEPERAGVRDVVKAPPGPIASGRLRRVLVVEDEVLVGAMIRNLLTESGHVVIGPVGSIAEASAALAHQPDAALLDINLGNELVYPLADRLRELAIPFIFLTGYSDDAIEHRFADAAWVEKPIDPESLLRAFGQLQEPAAGAQPLRKV